ncbi:hypothetical protein BDQ12DRAFT_773129 [Crucibulum laeve]|uniref:Uncharacterized protein n=1 Tax=Crucibulum laeve TaxID=68775 RepID=A0A5C3LI23_9AGAR|nr:hypothetical protein BDQ12DRAFT_773129 [Crucibulum laeve]
MSSPTTNDTYFLHNIVRATIVLNIMLSTGFDLGVPGNISLSSAIATRDTLPNGDPGSQRSLLDIIWTCASTIFACTWLSVHPNIPGPDESWFAIARGRAKLMLYALLMPEVVICWAIRQRAASLVIANNFTILFNVKWSIEHGFFAQMGGFMLCHEDKVVCALTPGGLEILLSRNLVDLPDITKEEIQDRSKGLAMLNGAMFAAWWKKPLDVHCSVRIQLKRQNNTPDWHALVSELHWMSPPPLSRTTSLMSNQEIEFQSVHAEEQEVAADNQEIELQSVNADEQEVAVGNQAYHQRGDNLISMIERKLSPSHLEFFIAWLGP